LLTKDQIKRNREYLYALRSGVRKPNEEERDLYGGMEKFIND